nr:MAG TPA: hypothetical protein [Caudoviricetes sp.]
MSDARLSYLIILPYMNKQSVVCSLLNVNLISLSYCPFYILIPFTYFRVPIFANRDFLFCLK